ncbi:MAG: OstA-like protein [Bacteroidia bacterium]|nr:OstA-like protein [Bacteroidia bacterium]
MKYTFLYSFLFLTHLVGFGQTKIEILSADQLVYDQNIGDYQLCKGNVQFKQGNMFMDCDSARFYDKVNKIEAFGDIYIRQQDTLDLHGDYLEYNGDSRLATIKKDVILSDGNMTLKTQQLNYDMINKVGYYSSGGHIDNGEDQLYSIRGTYFSRSKDVHFRDSVRLNNPDYIMVSDTLQYNTISKTATFLGPTYIYSEENTIFCNYGWYNTKTEISQFSQGAFIEGMSNRLLADSMVYERLLGFGEAFGNIHFTDTSKKMSIFGQYGRYLRLQKETLITGNPRAIKNIDGDSLFFKADTFIDYADTVNSQKRLLVAFHSVRMYKSDIQAYSDSLAYNFSDSSIGFFQEPVLWTDSNQITGDTVIVFRNKLGIKYMDVIDKGLVIEKDRNGLFNQISGRYIKANFDEGRLDNIFVDGNAQSIYYALEDSTKYSGVNEVFCGNMMINLDSNRVRTIKFMDQPKAIFYPLEKFPETKSKVPGFNWKNALKPQKIDFL